MIVINAVFPEHVGFICNLRKDLLQKAAEATFYETPESLIELARSGDAVCWVAWDDTRVIGYIFTQILDSPKRRTLVFLAFGGERGTRWIRRAREVVEAYAKAKQVNAMSAIRIGGKRTCLGMKPAGTYYEEEL